MDQGPIHCKGKHNDSFVLFFFIDISCLVTHSYCIVESSLSFCTALCKRGALASIFEASCLPSLASAASAAPHRPCWLPPGASQRTRAAAPQSCEQRCVKEAGAPANEEREQETNFPRSPRAWRRCVSGAHVKDARPSWELASHCETRE